MMNKRFLVACAAAGAMSWAYAQVTSATWLMAGPVTYMCGGVAQDGIDHIKSLRDTANAELIFTHGARGEWLADVDVTITGANMTQPVKFRSPGPACLLKLPAGDYTVEAEVKGSKRTQKLKGGGPVQRLMFNWPS